MAKQKTYQVWSATPTPFLDNAELDEASILRVVQRHQHLGVDGIFAAGTCGEGAWMMPRQITRLATLLKKHAGNQMHIAIQVTDTSSARVRENIKILAGSGVDSVVIAPPLLTRFCSNAFARRYFLESIETSPLPVGLYALNPPAAPPISLSVWREAALHPKVDFVKDSTSSEDHRRLFLEVREQRGKLLLLTGNEFAYLPHLVAGYDGVLAGTGILIAGLIRQALDALAQSNRVQAEAFEARGAGILWEIFGEDRSRWLGGLKYALVHLGLFSTEFMHLDYPLSDQDRALIDRVLQTNSADLQLSA